MTDFETRLRNAIINNNKDDFVKLSAEWTGSGKKEEDFYNFNFIDSSTPILLAAKYNAIDIFKNLACLNNTINIDIIKKGTEGRNILHYLFSSKNINIEILNMIINWPTITDDKFKELLNQKDSSEIPPFLLLNGKNGADILVYLYENYNLGNGNIENLLNQKFGFSGCSLLDKIILTNDNNMEIELIQELPESINTIDSYYDKNHNVKSIVETLLRQDIQSNSIDFMKFLINNGLDVTKEENQLKYETGLKNYKVNISNFSNNDLLHEAIGRNNIEAVNLLLEQGVDVNTINNIKQTPLLIATMLNNTELAKLLLEKGANKTINFTDSFCLSPILFATSHNNKELLQCLIDNGADVNIHGPFYQTPLFIAIQNKNEEIINIISNEIEKIEQKSLSERLSKTTKKMTDILDKPKQNELK